MCWSVEALITTFEAEASSVQETIVIREFSVGCWLQTRCESHSSVSKSRTLYAQPSTLISSVMTSSCCFYLCVWKRIVSIRLEYHQILKGMVAPGSALTVCIPPGHTEKISVWTILPGNRGSTRLSPGPPPPLPTHQWGVYIKLAPMLKAT